MRARPAGVSSEPNVCREVDWSVCAYLHGTSASRRRESRVVPSFACACLCVALACAGRGGEEDQALARSVRSGADETAQRHDAVWPTARSATAAINRTPGMPPPPPHSLSPPVLSLSLAHTRIKRSVAMRPRPRSACACVLQASDCEVSRAAATAARKSGARRPGKTVGGAARDDRERRRRRRSRRLRCGLCGLCGRRGSAPWRLRTSRP